MPTKSLAPLNGIERRIYLIRGHKVMLDSDLAELYGVEAKQLKRQVRRNAERFPSDFMFTLSKSEHAVLRSQIGTLKRGSHAKYPPYVFTEQGVAMLSSVLNSSRSIQVNISIMRAFVKLREMIASHRDFAHRLDNLEKKYNRRFRIVFDALRELMEPSVKPKPQIGFRPRKK